VLAPLAKNPYARMTGRGSECEYLPGWGGYWKEENIAKVRDVAYAMAKGRSERLAYEVAAEQGYEAVSICPLHVLGPLLGRHHDQPLSFQHRLKHMLQGEKSAGSFWNVVDVRDVARAHRLCAESSVAANGSRYILAAADRGGEMFTWQIKEQLHQSYPFLNVHLEELQDGQPKLPVKPFGRSYCLLAKQELGLVSYTPFQTLRDTADSMLRLGLVTLDAKL